MQRAMMKVRIKFIGGGGLHFQELPFSKSFETNFKTEKLIYFCPLKGRGRPFDPFNFSFKFIFCKKKIFH